VSVKSRFSTLIDQWKSTQAELTARRVVTALPDPPPRFVAGADVAFTDTGRTVLAVAVVYDRVERQVVEVRSSRARCDVPYIPTFLSFREGPALLRAINRVRSRFDVICFDGHGVAHPRRCGLATHLGVTIDRPSMGVAKSVLVGEVRRLAASAGSVSDVVHRGEVVARAVRTRRDVQPVFVSEGHRVTLESAVRTVLACATRYRIPEPTRLADQLVGRLKRGERVDRGG
jgi:deoxyribonuclease V